MKTGSLSGYCAALFFGCLIFAFICTWPIMISLGVLHSYFHAVPAFGFLAVMVMLWGADLMSKLLLK